MVAALGATTLALLALASCAKRQTRPQTDVPVLVARAVRLAVPYTLTGNGQVTPLQIAVVMPQVDGIVTRVAFQEGQEVSHGQVLFQIEPRPYQAAYEQAVAILARDSAVAANARREVQRYTELEQTDYVTKEQADQERATAAAAEATVAADRAALGTAKFNLDNTTIRAPIAGRTGNLLVREGNVVHGAGSTPLVVIDQIRPILVRFAVPATELPLVQASSARGELPVLASSSAAPTEVQPSPALGDDPSTAPKPAAAAAGPGGAPGGAAGPPTGQSPRIPSELGTLSFIDNTVDTTTGTVMLKATFANAAKSLWPGQFVAVSVRVYVEQNALVVPARAVLTGQQGAYVYVVDSGGAARQRRVTVERTADTVAVIAWGLTEGDPVVTDGQSRLTPGAKVSSRSAADSAAPAAPARRKGSQPAP